MATEAVHHGFAGRGGCRRCRGVARAVALRQTHIEWGQPSRPEALVPIVVPALRRALVVPFAVIPLTALLILRRHHPVRVALAIPDIEVGAMPTRHGIAAAAMVTLILQCGLILRRQIAVRIAHAITRAQIPAVAAWRRMDGDTVLHGLRQNGLRQGSLRRDILRQ